MPGASAHPHTEYRDPRGRLWQASEVAQLRVVSPAIDGPNLCLVIRFEREGEERFAHWIGGVILITLAWMLAFGLPLFALATWRSRAQGRARRIYFTMLALAGFTLACVLHYWNVAFWNVW